MKPFYSVVFIISKSVFFSLGVVLFFNLSSFAQTNKDCPKIGVVCTGGIHKGTMPNIPLNGNGSLGPTYNKTACGLNYVQGSVLIETRSATYGFNANGTGLPSYITIAGLPSCYVIDQAYLWFEASFNQPNPSPPSTSLTITNPLSSSNVYTPTLAGQDGDKCWGERGTATYRADVTTNISGNGVYNFNISGFSNGSYEIDGATLMIIYRNTSATFQGTLIIYDGTATSGGFNSYPATRGATITGFAACSNSSFANAFLIVADMQSNVNGNVHASTLNGATAFYPNNFWNFDQTVTNVTSGQSSSVFSSNGNNTDCFCVIVTGLYYQTTTCTTCTPVSSLTLSSSSSASLCGSCNGSASISASGGSSPYAYYWNSGATTTTVIGLCSGTYTVTVSDNSVCNTSIASIVITTSSGVIASIPASSNILCNGQCNGSATTFASGGTSPYNYAWSNGQTTPNSSGLCAASYKVTITDANNCSSSSTVVITQPSALVVSVTPTGISCFGGTNATASTSPGGGTAPYSYQWSNGQTNSSASGLSAASYSVTVTDANACKYVQSVIITQPAALSAAATSGAVTCNGLNNGNAAVSTSGGTSPYSYSWSNAKTSSSVTGLTAGSYVVTVRDANGCTSTATVSVTEPTAIVLSASSTPTGCNPPTGTVTVSSTGGSTPYIYLWNNGQTNSTATGLLAGTYTITVRDNNGCTKTVSVAVTQFSGVTASIPASSNILCNGQCNGSATAFASGGTSPYNYAWSNGQTTPNSSGLCAASYKVTITDVNNCASLASVIISEPSILTDSLFKTDLLCNGVNDGTAGLSVNGGTIPYSYSWNNGQTNSSISNLTGGNYFVTVVDANGCSISTSITITESGTIILSTSSNPTGCNPPNGIAIVSSSGGTAPYTYFWNNGETTPLVTGLLAGTYTVTVRDNNSCTTTASIIVTQLSGVTATIQTSSNISCNGQCNGNAIALAIGGNGPYNYSWSNGQTTANSNGLCAGSYIITITDANNCISTSSVIITEPLAISLSTFSTQTSCSPLNGTTTVVAFGGTNPYLYLWNNNQTTATATGLDAGTYSVIVTDGNNCTTITTATITRVIGVSASISNFSNVTCNGQCNGTALAAGSGGTTPYLYTWSNGQNTDVVSGLCSGIYYITVSDADNCVSVNSILITEPSALTTFSSNTSVLCNGANNGSASISADGGMTPYSYSWNNGQTNFSASGLTAGSFDITVSDANGCYALVSLTITEPTKIILSISSNPTACSQSNGTTSVNASGGAAPYTYLWNNGQTNITATGLNSGNYIVTLTDANNCTDTISIAVVNLGGPIVNVIALKNVTCNGWTDGSVTITSTGSSPFTYSWSPNGGTSVSATGLNAGTYTVNVTDTNGCVNAQSVTITEPPPIVLNFKRFYYMCAEGSGYLQLTASGGTTYFWSPSTGLSNPNIANPLVSVFTNITYTVTVSDGPCSDTAHVSISLVLPSGPPSVSQIGDSLFTSMAYTDYQWYYQGIPIGGATDFYYLATQTGNYSVYVTDTSGCRALSPALNVIILSANLSAIANNQIKVYPNPASQTFIILLPQSKNQNEKLTITDVIGREVYQRLIVNENQILIDATYFTSGVYIIQFRNGNKSHIAKVIKD